MRWPPRLLTSALALAAVALALLLPSLISPFYIRVLLLFFFFAGIALSWNMLGGYAGYWSFGHTAFIGIGAFTAGKLALLLPGQAGAAWILALSVLAGGGVSALFALVVAYPILRLRGITFAIAMLGVGQVMAELFSNSPLIQGAMGIVLPQVAPGEMAPERFFYYLFLGALALTLALSALIRRSKFGYGLAAIREDEDTARMLGVPTETYKIVVFVISAFLVGVFGVLYGYSLGYFTTDSMFRIDFSLNMILHSLIGGIGTVSGPIIGAAMMVVLTQVVLGSLLDVHMLITGALVVLIVLAAPNGIMGLLDTLRIRSEPGLPASVGTGAPQAGHGKRPH